MNIRNRLQEDSIIEARLATRLAGGLTTQLESLPHDVSERLRFAREKAVVRAHEVRQVAPASAVIAARTGGGAAIMGGPVPWWQRAASFAPLLMLVVGFLVIDHWSAREQVVAAADLDAQLLADDLPPEAYSDPGFAEFLRSSPNP
jgi:Protein of unknown function (DUF3619)